MLYQALVVLSLTLTAVSGLSYECPEPEDIFPCYCEEDDGDPNLHCNHFSKPQQIHDSLIGLKGHKIFQMSFFMNWILDPVESDAFKNIAVERVLFEKSTITLSSPQFQGMEDHLVSIQLSAIFNQTNPLATWSLGHLTKLKELTLDNNRILTLPDDWLESAPDSLKSLTLPDNSFVTLEDNVFSKLKHVTFLVLDSNRLTGLKRTMFPKPALHLRSLSLNNNRLRYLPYDLFDEMPNLRIIEMSRNRLTTLEETIWSGMWSQVSKLELSDNPLECDHKMKWMYAGQNKPILLYGNCKEPEHMREKSLKYLKLSDFS